VLPGRKKDDYGHYPDPIKTPRMTRQNMIQEIESYSGVWDICIIGGGATGLGAAVDSASRGFKTILLEQSDFAKGTSSRSTKLVHGGIRYLQQGNIKLVMEALHERGILRKNAPHLVKNQSFILPNYRWWEGPFYGIGLKVYDWMAGSLGLGASRFLSKEETLELAPTLDAEGLWGGVLYHDGQFDDARLAINLAQTSVEQGATVLNYAKVIELLKSDGKISGVIVLDELNQRTHSIRSKAVINATGVFTDTIMKMDDAQSENIIAPSQGVHIVLDKEFLPGSAAILVPHTDDGRVLFAVPWHNKIIVGTTDTPVSQISEEPKALEEEINFILQQIGHYLSKVPVRADVRSVFAGLRPLVKIDSKKTAELSRDHLILVAASGLITIAGGKWTTYRRMAEDVINTAIKNQSLKNHPCLTERLKIHGAKENTDFNAPLYYFGSDIPSIRKLVQEDPSAGELLDPGLPYIKAEITWAAQNEMCMTVEDALARRTRALLLDARAAMAAAPVVAAILAKQLNKDQPWVQQQISAFNQLAQQYLPN
jgi:glycerol-3-phosphate dehydrogenase